MTDEMNEILKECAEITMQPYWRATQRLGTFITHIKNPNFLERVGFKSHYFNHDLIKKYSKRFTVDMEPIDYARLYKEYCQEDYKEMKAYYADKGND
jgi:hypothetical protein